jgi:hypothetical protein
LFFEGIKNIVEAQQEGLMQPIDMNYLIEQADGLSYSYINLLFSIPQINELVKQIYNDTIKGNSSFMKRYQGDTLV